MRFNRMPEHVPADRLGYLGDDRGVANVISQRRIGPVRFELLEQDDLLQHRLGHDNGELGVGIALVFLQLCEPNIGPGSCTFRFP